ncbi:MAG: deoxyribonuclease V [Thiogranum sp.]|nr:deoxyribonuclease V [Thiogranum sp.]
MRARHTRPDYAALAADWPTDITAARAVQLEGATRVVRHDDLEQVRHVAGVDVGFQDSGTTTRAAVAVLNFPTLESCDQALGRLATCFPYIPGYLSFREIPAILTALQELETLPDLLLCDGQGLAHPRRFGLACHLGVVTDLPSIGVAKSRLIGTHAAVPEHRGAWVPLYDKDEIIGAVLRTRARVSPIYVSTGHRVSLPTAIDFVMRCTTRFRLPETTRQAHRLASGPAPG